MRMLNPDTTRNAPGALLGLGMVIGIQCQTLDNHILDNRSGGTSATNRNQMDSPHTWLQFQRGPCAGHAQVAAVQFNRPADQVVMIGRWEQKRAARCNRRQRLQDGFRIVLDAVTARTKVDDIDLWR